MDCTEAEWKWVVRILVAVQVRDNGGLDRVLSNGNVEKMTDPGNTLEVGLREPTGSEAK